MRIRKAGMGKRQVGWGMAQPEKRFRCPIRCLSRYDGSSKLQRGLIFTSSRPWRLVYDRSGPDETRS